MNDSGKFLEDEPYVSGDGDKGKRVKVSDVTYQDIHGTSATEVGVKLDCSPKSPCNGIKLQDVKLTFHNQAAQSSCVHAAGTASDFIQRSSCL